MIRYNTCLLITLIRHLFRRQIGSQICKGIEFCIPIRDNGYVSNEISLEEYWAPTVFRYQIRRFLHFSEQTARAAAIEPQQHQLLSKPHVISTALTEKNIEVL